MDTSARQGEQRAGVVLEGLRFDGLDEQQVIAHILDSTRQGRGGWLVNPNIDVMRQISADADVRELVEGSDLRVADGVPLLWAARLQRQPLPGLVAGSDLIWSLTEATQREGLCAFLLGGAPGVADRAARVLEQHYPGPTIATHCPPLGFEDDPQAMAAIREALGAARPHVVYCGLGFPKQERLAAQLLPDFPATWFLGTGAAMSFVAGDTARAPQWLRGTGLEWVHRLASEPRRLFRRYVVLDTPYAAQMLARTVNHRLRRGSS